VDAIRLGVLSTFVDKGLALVEDDREHVRLVGQGDDLLRGWKSASSRLTREGRLERRVVEGLRRENSKYGRLRVTILPPLPGLAANAGDE
jgi:hypothetical protein